MPLLELRDLHVDLGGAHVLQGARSRCPGRDHGAARAQRGRQDDTLRAVLGLVAAGVGRASRARRSRTRRRTGSSQRGVGYVPEDRDVFAGLTVEENLRLAVRNGAARYELVYELFPELKRAPGSGPARSPAGSSRWSRSPGRCSTRAGCS